MGKMWYQNLQHVRWERTNWYTGKVSIYLDSDEIFHASWLWMLASVCFFSEELGQLEYDIRWKIPSWESFVPSFPRSEASASTILWSPAQCDSEWQTFSSRPISVLQPISLPELSADIEKVPHKEPPIKLIIIIQRWYDKDIWYITFNISFEYEYIILRYMINIYGINRFSSSFPFIFSSPWRGGCWSASGMQQFWNRRDSVSYPYLKLRARSWKVNIVTPPGNLTGQ